MGVLACNRSECENIMCDTYINGIGYICNDCKDEFKMYLSKNHIELSTDLDIIKELKMFTDTPKDQFAIGKDISVDDFFNENSR